MKSVAAKQAPPAVGARVRVLLKEVGSLPLESGSAAAFDETVVIAQMKGEPAASFAERALERFASLRRGGRRLGSVTLQVGREHDARTLELRQSLLVALLDNGGASAATTEISLEASARLGAAEHEALLGLVDGLLQRSECASVPVSLRFRDQEPEREQDSGVFWVAPTRP